MKIALIITGSIILIIVTFLLIISALFKKNMKNYTPEDDSKKLLILDDNNFTEKTSKGIVLVDFWAAWCQPCRILGPIINELAEEIDQAKIAKLNIDENRTIANKYHIKSIPTIIIFKDGKQIERISGIKPKHYLKKIIDKAVNDN